MSYNRTVTCSWCYNTGHNKAGCPDHKKYIIENPNGYEAAKTRSKKNRPRACGYCKQPGHNRKTCVMLRTRRDIASKRNKEFRAAMLMHLKNFGIGIGALAKWESTHTWGSVEPRADQRGIVNCIEWSRLNVWNASNAYYGLRVISCITFATMAKKGLASRANWLATVPPSANGFGEPEICSEYAVGAGTKADADWIMSPLSPEDVEKGVPAGWLDGTDGALAAHFDKAEHHSAHEWVER